MNAQERAIKHDGEKVRLELLSSTWLFGVGRVLTFGAKKYDAHNWRKGLELSRLLGAALRHILLFLGGEDLDSETGLSHLYHASCCMMFASEMHETRPELDDRYKPETNETVPAGTLMKLCDCGGVKPYEAVDETPSEYAARLRKEIDNGLIIDEHKAGIAAHHGEL